MRWRVMRSRRARGPMTVLATVLATKLMALALLATGAGAARAADPLVVDLSSHVVSITAGFAGADLLLFGAVEQPGDVIVVVRGPPQRVVVRKKERIGGVWINMESFAFTNVPGYYGVASTRPLSEVASPVVLDLHGIGVDQLQFDPADTGADAAPDPADQSSSGQSSSGQSFSDRSFSGQSFEALSRIKQRQRLYGNEVGEVTFVGGGLFRSAIQLPANVPTGTYDVKVFLLQDGNVAGIRNTPLVIEKTGIGAAIFNFAHRHSALYGLVAVVLALVAGWLAEIAFRRA